jgi:predicted O-methyltransferase YrrM
MEEILSLKPESIFKVVDDSIFIEKNDARHNDYMHCGNYYEIYYAISKYYQPKSILEIGVRYGYSLYSMMAAADNLNYVRGYDIDEYDSGSIEEANKNISKVISDDIDFKIEFNDSQKISELSQSYDLIHIDGDHSYGGKIHDLNLTKGKCKVLIIDDYNHIGEVKNATNKFIEENSELISKHFSIGSMRGTYIVEYK